MNLTTLYERGQAIVESAIRTAGTKVSVLRDADLLSTVTVDKTTLAVADSTPATAVMSNVPAIAVRVGVQQVDAGPGRKSARPAYRILLRSNASEVRQYDLVRFETSQDAALIGLVLVVTEATVDPSGAFHDLTAVSQ